MFTRILTLLLKELRQHTVVLGLVMLCMPPVWLILVLGTFAGHSTVSYMEIHTTFLRFMVIPFGFALGNRLIVTELYGRTQLFLEALPMHRAEPFVVKWIMGFGVLGGVAMCSLFFTMLVASTREPLDLPFVLSLTSRTLVFSAWLWAFLFLMGLLGKMRIPVYVLLMLVVLILAETTELEVSRFGPFALIGSELALSRTGIPWSEAGITLALTLGFVVVSGVLLSISEGSVQEVLSKPMSSRERAMMGISIMFVLTVWTGLQPDPEPLPYEMTGDFVTRSERVPLVIAYGAAPYREASEALLARLEPSLEALQSGLALTELPEMRVVLRAGLDGRTFDTPTLRGGDGALVRANFLPEANPDLEGLEAALIGSFLDGHSGGRACFEPQCWVRDGFALWWATCGPHRPQGGAACEASADRALQALLFTREHEATANALLHWETSRETRHPRVAESFAFDVMRTLAHQHGANAPLQLARSRFGQLAPTDSRATWSYLVNPVQASVQEVAGTDLPALVEAWQADAQATRARADVQALAGPLWPIPVITQLTFESEGDSQRNIVIDLAVAPPWRDAEGVTVTVHTRLLGPLDELVRPWETRRDVTVLTRGEATRHIVIRGQAARGNRLLIMVDIENSSAGLSAPIRLFSERRLVP